MQKKSFTYRNRRQEDSGENSLTFGLETSSKAIEMSQNKVFTVEHYLLGSFTSLLPIKVMYIISVPIIQQ